MNPSQASTATRFRVGIFTLLSLLLIGGVTVYVNDKPFWWRPCQLVHINIEDATGLKAKSAVRSLGLQIGYLKTVELFETHVRLGICLTAPVEVLPATRAYIRGEGFLGDKFVELKPLKYTGTEPAASDQSSVFDWIIPPAYAEDAESAPPKRKKEKEIPVGEGNEDMQHLIGQVNNLVNEMTSLTNNLKEAVNPQELRQTMRQLNRTLENASRTLSPEGNLNTTAQRALAKLEDAIEQLRDMFTRINKGEGSVGMLINDPTYAEELKEALKNVNKLLSKTGGVKFVVDMGAQEIAGYGSGRGWFKLQIWPDPTRYYLLGIGVDPRGKRTVVNTTTTAGGLTATTQTVTVEESGLLLTGMLGKVLWNRLELAAGVLHSDAAATVGIWVGPHDHENTIQFYNDVYSRGKDFGIDYRFTTVVRPWSIVYLQAGVESIHRVDNKIPLFVGAGVSFDDDVIKLLFALR